VVRTGVPLGEDLLCRIGGLKVTPWHPVYVPAKGGWVFPVDVVVPEMMSCNAVYSVLLRESVEMIVEQAADAHTISVADV